MTNANYLENLLKIKAQQESPPIIELFNKDWAPVGAIYLNKVKADIEDIIICETKTSEKYYLYINGIALFFTYYTINTNNI